jgi:hypothetical protein
MDMVQPPTLPPRRRKWYLAVGVAVIAAVALVLVLLIPRLSGGDRATPLGLAGSVATAISQHDNASYTAFLCAKGPDRLGQVEDMPEVPGPLSVGPSNVIGPDSQSKYSSALVELLIPGSNSAVVVSVIENNGSTQWCLSAVSECDLGLDDNQNIQQGGLCVFLILIKQGSGPTG